MKTPISIIDYATIIFYFALVIALGIATSKGQSREGFLIADRNLKTFANSTSMVASKIGAGVIMTFVALVYLFGYSAIWYFVGASAGYIVFVFFAIMLKKMSHMEKFYTLPDYFFFKFGKRIGFVSSTIVLVYTLFALLVQLIGGAKAISLLSGFSFTISILLLVGSIFIYTILGGFRAIVKTDVVQLISIVLIIILLCSVMTKAFDRQFISSAFTVDKSLPLKFSISFFIMVVGFLGTVVFIISKPVTATLVLNSIALTISGFVLEYLMALTLRIKQTE